MGHKNKWNLSYINQFKNSISVLTNRFKNQDKKVTCDDYGLELIVTFAMENNLPFKWKTGAEDFDAELTKYSNFNSFLLAVKRKCGAPDFANENNTNIIPESVLKIGSLVVLTSKDGGRINPNHIQIVSDILRLEPQMQYNIYQGNFTDFFLLGRVTGSDDPESIRYLGVNIQDGFYDKQTDTFTNTTKNTTTTRFYAEHYRGQYREFKFLNWN